MKKCLLLAGLFACAAELLAAQFTLFDKNGAARIFVPENETVYVKAAVADLKSDAAKVGNAELADTKSSAEPALFVGSLTNPEFKKLAEKLGIDAGEIEGGWKNCYRGELKMNFAELLKFAKSAQESAKKIKDSDF